MANTLQKLQKIQRNKNNLSEKATRRLGSCGTLI